MQPFLKVFKSNQSPKIIAVSLGHFTNDFFMNLLIPISFMFKADLGLTYSQQAMIGTVIISLGTFAQPLIGYIVDLKGKPILLIYSVLWIGLFTSVTGFVHDYYLLLFLAGAGALASSLYHPLGSSYLINLLGKSKGTGLSIFITVGSFAIGLAPFIAIPLVTHFGLESIVLFIIPTLLCVFAMLKAGIHKGTMPTSHSSAINLKNISFSKAGWLASLVGISVFRNLVTRSFLLVFGLQILLLKGVSPIAAGFAVSLIMWSMSAGTFIGGFMTDQYSGKTSLLFSNVGILCFMILFYFSNSFIAMISYIIIGFFTGIGNTPNITLAQELIPNNSSTATGLVLGLGGGLGGIVMLYFGNLADKVGLNYSLGILIIPLVIITLITMVYPSNKRIQA